MNAVSRTFYPVVGDRIKCCHQVLWFLLIGFVKDDPVLYDRLRIVARDAIISHRGVDDFIDGDAFGTSSARQLQEVDGHHEAHDLISFHGATREAVRRVSHLVCATVWSALLATGRVITVPAKSGLPHRMSPEFQTQLQFEAFFEDEDMPMFVVQRCDSELGTVYLMSPEDKMSEDEVIWIIAELQAKLDMAALEYC